MIRMIPESLANRTLLVLIFGLMVSHTISLALYSTDRTSALALAGASHVGEHIITIVRLVEDAAPSERRRVADLLDASGLHIAWGHESAFSQASGGSPQDNATERTISAHLASAGVRNTRFRKMDPIDTAVWNEHFQRREKPPISGETLLIDVQLRDTSWLNFAVPFPTSQPFWSFRFILSTLVMLAAVTMASILLVRQQTKPLVGLAQAAQRLGTDVKAPPLSESGPSEIRYAARAFNEMQARIRRFVEDRTQMLAAIAHDLGTPITRLRLRAEFVEDIEQQGKMISDLDDMQKMVASALSFARGEAADEPSANIDLDKLLQRICDDMADSVGPVRLAPSQSAVPYVCRPVALRRALTNLIDNALRYGHTATVALSERPETIIITIDDAGSGIPEELLEQAFKPFWRFEASRNRETGGSGLGLAAARTIVRGHGGEVTLSNRDDGGFRAEVILPR